VIDLAPLAAMMNLHSLAMVNLSAVSDLAPLAS
jgi:internalin A